MLRAFGYSQSYINSSTSEEVCQASYFGFSNAESIHPFQENLNQIAQNPTNFGKGLGVVLGKMYHSFSSKEKPKLESAKLTLLSYYNYLLPDSEYIKEVSEKVTEARHYVEKRVTSKAEDEQLAAVFDVDDTAISHVFNFINSDFENTPEQIDQRLRMTDNPPILPVLKFQEYLINYNVECFYISYRIAHDNNPDKDLYPATLSNLKQVGYSVKDGNVFLPEGEHLSLKSVHFKTNIRKKLTDQGYSIILSMGDQPSDLGEYSELNILLPNKLYGPSSLLDLKPIIDPNKKTEVSSSTKMSGQPRVSALGIYKPTKTSEKKDEKEVAILRQKYTGL